MEKKTNPWVQTPTVAAETGAGREQEMEVETGARNLRRLKPDQIKSGRQQDLSRANL
jgi:hypothetical protein